VLVLELEDGEGSVRLPPRLRRRPSPVSSHCRWCSRRPLSPACSAGMRSAWLGTRHTEQVEGKSHMMPAWHEGRYLLQGRNMVQQITIIQCRELYCHLLYSTVLPCAPP